MPLTRKTMGLRHVAWPLITLAALFSVHTNAATVNVIDTDGFPLEHAVIEVYIERAASPAPLRKTSFNGMPLSTLLSLRSLLAAMSHFQMKTPRDIMYFRFLRLNPLIWNSF